jgi:hypothetical protein
VVPVTTLAAPVTTPVVPVTTPVTTVSRMRTTGPLPKLGWLNDETELPLD